ncbi:MULTISPECIES: nucleoside triphosphate pyrophosphohydrolase [Brevibacillus]|jgi:predicted house-cleaning noncanonical NTP pyrophosphatase (MazG superfamily)|uniref:nucleoside triphosphate pyrophosphohydrolase n=1 Tax=Brevibacillus TaxID=55080 RepID=UPI00149287EC|nr:MULTISPECIES: nucleoside triphosphate pyrophosphohydrolase [Brevibacillus]MDT3416774.1 putative house-cleaning noncanonical NTP pyrophosphatase (MazG superfamily) [Brevibacillus aydinogluensis]NNV01635.1 phosphoribosyl-ATP pyrophosphohydrolase [Brevibacillus sp. MCWH]
MPIYNKLIRDRIPEIIAATGKRYTTSVLSDEEYLVKLREKCQEELDEYNSAKSDRESLEELADVLEVVYALARVHGASPRDLEEIRRSKAEKRGGFEQKLFLHEVED